MNNSWHAFRHPMYASIWLWSLAQGMLVANWLAGWSVLPVFAAMYFLHVPREERLMVESFGEAVRDSMWRTGRVFPWGWGVTSGRTRASIFGKLA